MSSQLQVSGEAKIRDIQGPVVANSGVITALDGAASQYVRGDGTLADFPTSTGGGSSVSYYLNSSVSQGTIGGVAYRELSKEPIIGAGTDIAISANGYVASYLTDANDPDVVLIPGGNFNCEFYFSVNNNTGNPFFYAELYKYDGTTFTLLGSSVGVPEYINQGTVINPYYFAIPVATATLALTDRLAIRIYVNVDGRTVTLHTENGHLCQVVTTLSKGMVSLNNLTDQSQFITTGTSGTDFNIVSSGDTHTFNIPSASASNRGLITTGSQTIAGIKTLSVPSQFEQGLYLKQNMNLFQAGYIGLGASTTGLIVGLSGGGFGTLNFNNTTSFTYTFPNATGTLALTSDISYPVTSVFGRTGAVVAVSGDYNTSQVTENTNLYFTDARARAALSFTAGSGAYNSTTGVITIPTNNNQITNGSNFITLASLSGGTGISYNNTTGVITNSAPDQTVSLTAGAGISISGTYPSFTIASTITQYTDALARTAISLTTTGTSGAATYNSTTGVFNIPNYAPDLSGYVPTSRTITINGTSFDLSANRSYSVGTVTSVGLSSATSGVTIGSTPITTSGTITLAIATASGSQNGLLSSTDWITFNGKQAALNGTGFVKISGTTISYDNSTYLTTSAASSTYLPLTGGTLTGALNGTTATFSGILSSSGGDIRSAGTAADSVTAGPFISVRNASNAYQYLLQLNATYGLDFWTFGGTWNKRMTLDASGNLGLGVTPSAWSDFKVLEFANGIYLGTYTGGGQTMYLGANNYFNGSDYIYKTSAYATRYQQVSGVHAWYTSTISGTAGNVASFNQSMALLTNGNLLIGTTTDAGYKLDVNGTGRFSGALSGTSATFSSTLAVTIGGAGISLTGTVGSNSYYVMDQTPNSGGKRWRFGHTGAIGGFGSFDFYNQTDNITALTLASTGAATFSSSVTAQGGSSSGFVLNYNSNASSRSWAMLNDQIAFGDFCIQQSNTQTGTTRTTRLLIDANGNVGIGTTSPNTKLEVNGNIRVSTNGTNGGDWGVDDGGIAISSRGSTPIAFWTNDFTNPRMRITSGGNVLIGTITDAGQKLQVNGTASFSSSVTVNGLLTNYNTFNTQTASYTLVLSDASKIIETNVSSANTVTVPTNASVAFPIGTEITIMQYGAGVTTIASAGGVTINSKSNARIIANRYTGATLVKRGTDEWYLIGNIVP